MDVITYALCKKAISSSTTGIKKIELIQGATNDYSLRFTLGDNTTTDVNLPIKPDCINFEYVNVLPLSGISETTVYVVPKTLNPGNDAYYQYMYVGGAWKLIGSSGLPYATETQAGIVRPDGITITVDANGVISVKKDGLENMIDNYINSGDNDLEDSSIDGLF